MPVQCRDYTNYTKIYSYIEQLKQNYNYLFHISKNLGTKWSRIPRQFGVSNSILNVIVI